MASAALAASKDAGESATESFWSPHGRDAPALPPACSFLGTQQAWCAPEQTQVADRGSRVQLRPLLGGMGWACSHSSVAADDQRTITSSQTSALSRTLALQTSRGVASQIPGTTPGPAGRKSGELEQPSRDQPSRDQTQMDASSSPGAQQPGPSAASPVRGSRSLSEAGWTRREVLNAPNAISAARILSGPLIAYWILAGQWGPALAALVISGPPS